MEFLKKTLSFPRGSAGISLQAGGVSIAHVEQSKNSSLILNCAEFFPFQDVREAADLLKSVVRRNNFPRNDCVAILDTGSYQLLQVEPPEVPEEEIRSAVRWQVKDLLNYELEEAVLDVFLVPKAGFRKNRIAFVVASPKETILGQVNLFREARLEIGAVDIPEMVLRNIGSRLPEAREGLAFLFLQNKNGLILLLRDTAVYLVRKINFGLNDILSSRGEETAGDPFGEDAPGNYYLENLVLEIQRSLDFYESGFNLSSINHLIVAPMDEKQAEMLPFFQRNLSVNVRLLDTVELFGNDLQLSPSLQARCLTAIGGAMRGFAGAV